MTLKKADKKSEETKAKPKTPELLRGFRDILPDEQAYWDLVESAAHKISTDYSFGRIRLPLLERTALFERSVGKGTDIVEKEMFTFADQNNDRVTLRPEATAQVARAYIEHGMTNLPQPVKLWYYGPMFRYDRPQAGRYRQFYQWGLEAIGSSEPVIDAQIIIMLDRFMKELGLDTVVKINSIGTPESRMEYVMELASYFKQHRRKLSDIDKKRLTKNPLRLLDSKEEGIDELRKNAPQILDWLDESSKQHLMQVLEYLDEVDVSYELDPFLVRGLDYYTQTVFEMLPILDSTVDAEEGEEKAQSSIAGGGRYDGLIPLLGGREDTAAMGAAVGIERVILAMKKKGVEVEKKRKIDVFFCQLGEAARKKGLAVFEEFRKSEIPAAEAFGKGSLKAQLELADRMGAKLSLILGQKEVLDGTIIIRDMESGGQEIVDITRVIEIVRKRLG
ncbi:MAG: histidine--tRNA ligase [bacterium]